MAWWFPSVIIRLSRCRMTPEQLLFCMTLHSYSTERWILQCVPHLGVICSVFVVQEALLSILFFLKLYGLSNLLCVSPAFFFFWRRKFIQLEKAAWFLRLFRVLICKNMYFWDSGYLPSFFKLNFVLCTLYKKFNAESLQPFIAAFNFHFIMFTIAKFWT